LSIITLPVMRSYLSKSISSLNRNKLNGLLAEVDFRNYLARLGFQNQISVGGWICRCEGPGNFGHKTVAFFPETVEPDTPYPPGRNVVPPHHGLHAICSTLHSRGINSYYCVPTIMTEDDLNSITWHAVQLGLPSQQGYQPFPQNITGFNPRTRKYTFLRYKTDVGSIPDDHVDEEFSKEHLRVTFQDTFMAEISDIDGIFWGKNLTYPIEIKEKTAANDRRLGDYFGLDVGPFVKLAFYVAMRGSLSSIFIVREIDNVEERNLIAWWFISFETLAQFASWTPVGGGTNMQGGASSVIKIPKSEFLELTRDNVEQL
jgi:hypothetical protein